ncbi:MAG: TonB-dependent receptor [Campylobacterales bacterium]|nr:TonB-dependent receptor [Campylobacterales bacterium]
MNKNIAITLSMIVASNLFAESTAAYQIETIRVSDSNATQNGFELQNNQNINSQSYNQKAIELLAGQSYTTPLQVIDMSPSVNFQPADIFGSNESSFHDPLRIRGKNQSGPGGVILLEGIPISGNPGGGKTAIDMENIAAIDLYKGFVPVDKGLGFSNLIGKVDLSVEKPRKEQTTTFSQMLGSNDAKKSFIRFDTGQKGDWAAFGSLSYTEGDKWKGKGDLERKNGMLGITYTPNDHFKADIFAIRNSDDHHSYYGLTYDEAKDIEHHYNKDWNSYPTKGSANYYDWNKQKFDDTILAGNLIYTFNDDSLLSFKPYYLKDKGEYWFANAKQNRVIQWLIDHDLYGAVTEYERTIFDTVEMKLGYWYGRQQPPGPPVSQRRYTIDASGSLVFNGWNMLAKNGYHEFNSPFIEFSGEINRFSYAIGARYLDFRLGSLHSYTNGTNGSTSTDYGTAIEDGTLDSWASVNAKKFNKILPSMYFAYQIDDSTEIYADYTKSYGMDVNLFPSYVSNRANYVPNVTLQQLWDKQELELSDNFDIGIKYTHNGITYAPNLFFTNVTDKQATIFDPLLNVKYPSNCVDAKSYGAEFALSGNLSDQLEFMASAAYNKYYYTQNLKTSPTETSTIKGNQIPDTPLYTFKGSLTYSLEEWKISPIIKYTASRYGNVDNTQKIPGYTVVDLNAQYPLPKIMGSKESTLDLQVTNLFDKKYIGSIITPDNALSVDTTQPSYLAGMPFGIYATINIKF